MRTAEDPLGDAAGPKALGQVDLHLGLGRAWAVHRPGDLGRVLIGRPVEEVAEVLPRLFNLCRQAQTRAVALALGRASSLAEDAGLEVLADHRAKVFVLLRLALGLTPMAPVPFTPLPDDPDLLERWIDGPAPEADLARLLRAQFSAGEAVTLAMPFPKADQAFALGMFENSAAGRQAGHPVLQAVAANWGRGPLWRYLGLLADAEAAAKGRLPGPWVTPGAAVVQAARGAYALRLAVEGGRLVGLTRVTPTDQQLAPGGAVDRALATLPGARVHLAPQVLALLDPCLPVRVIGGARDA